MSPEGWWWDGDDPPEDCEEDNDGVDECDDE